MSPCEYHDTGEGVCNCTAEEVRDRADKAAARRAAPGGLAKARAALDQATPTPENP